MAVKKDEIIGYVNLGQLWLTPELAKREVTTAVLVDSGQTVVVGGVYEFTSAEDIKKVPFWATCRYWATCSATSTREPPRRNS